ncbi:MAG TPA: M28 family peptidase [Thermoanaerobaculia bacterium]
MRFPRLSLLALLLTVSSATLAAAPPEAVQRSLNAISGNAVKAHVKFLASDLLEGRGPGTRGDALATQYIASQFEEMGLLPAGDGGSYFQKVSLLGVTTIPAKTSVSFVKQDGPTLGPLKFLDEFVGADLSQTETNTFDSEIVFVGHGVVAPEENWDDYKGLDTRGKTLVMLVNDPPATAAEPNLFKGRARTYYGRWTYKLEIGAAKQAKSVILIHTNDAAGYGWNVVRNSWSGEQGAVKNEPGKHALTFAGWMTESVAKRLFAAAGYDLDTLTKAAGSRDFKPVPLGGYRMQGNVASTIRPFVTNNVVARLEGTDPQLKNQAVLYSAHHDHLGVGTPNEAGDRIYNGAIDNASGCGLLLELARVWSEAATRPKRSLIFAAVAAEEQGLLGSEFFGRNPVIPAGNIALGINMDAIYLFGKVSGVTMLGAERMSFEPATRRIAEGLGLTIVPDPAPEQGSYYRSDHFSLAKAGVPAFSIKQGNEIVGKDAEYGKQRSNEYRTKHYHQPSDEVDPTWDWSSAEQVGQLAFWLGYEAANAAEMPNWNAGDEFRAIRDRSQGMTSSSGAGASGATSPQPRPRQEKER